MSLSCKEQGRLADAELELEECTSCLVRSEKYQELYLGHQWRTQNKGAASLSDFLLAPKGIMNNFRLPIFFFYFCVSLLIIGGNARSTTVWKEDVPVEEHLTGGAS